MFLLSEGGHAFVNVGGHASQRDTCHVFSTYVLLRRWEASPPTLLPMRCCDAGKRRLLRCSLCADVGRCTFANVGGHASQRDTCHVFSTYALLRRWERPRVGERSSGMASPPTLPPMCCCDAGKRRLLHCYLCAVATLGSVASYTATYALLRRWEASPLTLQLMR